MMAAKVTESTGTRPTSKGSPIPYRSRSAFNPQTAAAQKAGGKAGQVASSVGPRHSQMATSPVHAAPTTTNQDPAHPLGDCDACRTGTESMEAPCVGSEVLFEPHESLLAHVDVPHPVDSAPN